jgi:adenine-specific DNA-methyltransferase
MAKKDYTNWSKEELIKEVDQLRKRKKYGLVWEDKPENVVEQCKTELPVLEEVKDKEIITDPNKPINLLIEGDNYHALSVLNYTHKGAIDVIYIDPPYNTGNKDFIYNDQYVDREDSYRHSKWLAFMSKRLLLAKKLLSSNGVIFISIGNDEIGQLKMLCDQIFNEKKEHNIIHWKKNQKPQNASQTISESAEYLLVYFSKNPIKLVRPMMGTRVDEDGSYKPTPLFKFDKRPRRVQIIPAGTTIEAKKWGKGKIFGKRNKLAYIEILDEPLIKDGVLQNDVKVDGQWCKTEAKGEYQKVVSEGRLFINSNGFPNEKAYRDEDSRNVHTNLWLDAGYNELGKQTLDQVLGEDNIFSYPKPIELVKEILKSIDNPNATVLDFFAGSGTTGHAVLDKNSEDGGNRRFILITNNEEKIMDKVCYPRIEKVIKGYKFNGTEKRLLYEHKINFTALKKAEEILRDIEKIEFENNDFAKISKSIESDYLKVYGELKISDKKNGLGGNLKYYKTSFVPAESTDKNRNALTKKATEMLCIKEDTFVEVRSTNYYKIFQNKKRFTGIIFDHQVIDEFKKEIAKIDGKFNLYIFSLGDDTFEEEFEDMKKKVKLSPIPEAILRVYRRIFK